MSSGDADKVSPPSATLAKIRQAISASKPAPATAGAPLAIEPDKSNSILTRKIGETDGLPPVGGGGSMGIYAFIPGLLFSWKFWLVAILLFAIFWVVRPYISLFKNITDMVNSILDDGKNDESENEHEGEEKGKGKGKAEGKGKGKDKGKGKGKGAEEEEERPRAMKAIKEKVEGTKQKFKASKAAFNDPPMPDESASSVQGGAQGGFCLAGEWDGARSCIKVDSANDCISGQLFQTQATCQNPSLRA